jgi:hypothetical protein
MLWCLWFAVFHAADSACPLGTPYYYDSKMTFSLNQSQWYYFWTTLMSDYRLHISVWSSAPYALYVGNGSECPNHRNSVLLRSTEGRSFLATEFFGEGERHSQAFGVYAVNFTTVTLSIEDHVQSGKGLSVPMKLAMPFAGAALAFLGYDFFRGKRGQ